jgi:hypothetical protein
VTWLCATVRLLGESNCTDGLQNVTLGQRKSELGCCVHFQYVTSVFLKDEAI